MNQQPQIGIIGAGLTGLTLAYLLKQQGIEATIFEARDRIGGRIHTLYKENGPSIEMGATWLGKKHVHLVRMLEDLGIEIKEQYIGSQAVYELDSMSPPQLVSLPNNPQPSFRIVGGSGNLIQTLAQSLEQDQIRLSTRVESVQWDGLNYTIKTNQGEWKSDLLVSTLPPYLLVKSINFEPALSSEFVAIAKQTHTWMGESIKVALQYPNPFWREPQSSGTIVSNVGPVQEMYDHSDEDGFALKGFMNGAYFATTKEKRLELILNQLRKYYGNQVDQYLSYEETVWRKEPFSFQEYEGPIIPHQNNGKPVLRSILNDNTFWIAGSETAPHFPGYMDGAVESAQLTTKSIQNQLLVSKPS